MSGGYRRVHGLGAEFDSAADLFHAAEKVREEGYKRWDVFSPFPIHGMDDAMGLGPSRVSLGSLIGGICGFSLAVFMIYYASEIDYPLVVHGKPFFSVEASFPIMFELTILLTAFATLFTMLALNRLPMWHRHPFNWDRFEKVTHDGFFLIIESRDPKFSEDDTRKLLEKIGGKHVTLIEEEEQ